MHSSGVDEPVVSIESAKQFLDAGADIVLVPAVGTVLGIGIQHIGDANMGLVGIENIKELSDAIRGKRHTVARMARSIHR